MTVRYEMEAQNFEWLLAGLRTTYWGKSLTREALLKSCKNSYFAGVFHEGAQVGFARAISDRVTAAYLTDVYVDAACRGQGFGIRAVDGLMAHPMLKAVPHWGLGTVDAHGFYERLGFVPSGEGIFMHQKR